MSVAYLDHASTSPLRGAARSAMQEWLLDDVTGDPGRIHSSAMAVRAQLEHARSQIAAFFGAASRSVVFTSGATEAIASACWGGAAIGDHQVITAIEHSAVRRSAEQFSTAVTIVGCNSQGQVDVDEVLSAINADTAMVHVQWGNHEVGTLQPIHRVIEACRERGVLVHVDAAQAAGHVPIDFDALGADLMSVSAHKMGGPAGIGALLVRRGIRLRPLIVGGDQERARRAGLENVLGAIGWAAACNGAVIDPERERALSDRIAAIASGIDGVVVLGDRADRLPHITCVTIAGVEPQGVLLGLDQRGIAAHSGSACSSEDLLPSPVLEAMGIDAHHSLRLSVGWSTSDADIDRLAGALPEVISYLRSLAGS
ncbi:MAG: cysteine desulfurase family protein [Acidimicrobiia bacterium]